MIKEYTTETPQNFLIPEEGTRQTGQQCRGILYISVHWNRKNKGKEAILNSKQIHSTSKQTNGNFREKNMEIEFNEWNEYEQIAKGLLRSPPCYQLFSMYCLQ